MTTQAFNSLTIGEVVSSLRDLSIFSAVAVAGWKFRGIFQRAEDFLSRIEAHMTKMETFAEAVVTNHLRHIEADLRTLSGRKFELSDDYEPNPKKP